MEDRVSQERLRDGWLGMECAALNGHFLTHVTGEKAEAQRSLVNPTRSHTPGSGSTRLGSQEAPGSGVLKEKLRRGKVGPEEAGGLCPPFGLTHS